VNGFDPFSKKKLNAAMTPAGLLSACVIVIQTRLLRSSPLQIKKTGLTLKRIKVNPVTLIRYASSRRVSSRDSKSKGNISKLLQKNR
jgi:hypothetical protein